MSDWTEIDSERYLFLTSITEPEDNVLRLVIEAAHASGEAKDLEIAGHVISDTVPIIADQSTPAWEVIFESYVAYAVRNESYTTVDEEEVSTGKLFLVYQRSKFLDFIAAGTFADESHPGPFVHYGILCLNHILDVASTEPPMIMKIRTGQRPN